MKDNKNNLKQFICSPIGKLIMIAALFILFFGIFLLLILTLENTVFAFVYAALFIYFGWKSLDVVQPNVFLVMPIGGWFLYGLMKGLLSFFIGIFVAPIALSNMISTKIQQAVGDTLE